MSRPPQSFFASSRLWLIGTLLLLFGLGLAIRLYDLTDLPLDFHPTRQLLSALKARGMYYQSTREFPDWQRKLAIQQWKLRAEVEPEFFEHIVAFTYRFSGVQLWVARVYSSLFWTIGGIFLFLLIQDLVSTPGAIAGTAYYLFVPFGVIASRSFQPDPLMVMLIIAFWWALARWTRTAAWGWAILAGLVGGLAIYIKFVAAFFVIAAALSVPFRKFKAAGLVSNRQVWAMAALGIIPAGIYIFYGVVLRGFLGRQFTGRFIPALLLRPPNYIQWASLANAAAGGVAIALAWLSLVSLREKSLRTFLIGLWCAYLLFGLVFDYHVATHDYYHLPLIPIVAVSLAPLADRISKDLAGTITRPVQRLAVFGSLAYALLSVALDVHDRLTAVDYRPQAAMWAAIGDQLGHGPNVVALTQDYGSRLAYWGWQNAIIWPNSGDIDYHDVRGGSIDYPELFQRLTTGNAFFLVTDFEELKRQPDLEARLSDFAVHAEGDGYLIYDLQKPLRP